MRIAGFRFARAAADSPREKRRASCSWSYATCLTTECQAVSSSSASNVLTHYRRARLPGRSKVAVEETLDVTGDLGPVARVDPHPARGGIGIDHADQIGEGH